MYTVEYFRTEGKKKIWLYFTTVTAEELREATSRYPEYETYITKLF